MRIILTILKNTLITLGILFLIQIIAIIYIWQTDPLNIKALIPQGASPIKIIKTLSGRTEIKIDNIDKNPLLNEEQEAQLEAIGVEPSDLPSEITNEMESCFTKLLGEKRSKEIQQGAKITTDDYLQASSCIN